MGIILDISSNQGVIDWAKVSKDPQKVNGVILRATTRNGNLDVRTVQNYNGILQNMNDNLNGLSFYKFSYARDYMSARIECMKTLHRLFDAGIRKDIIDMFYLDLEAWGGRDYTRDECNEVITGYFNVCNEMDVNLGLYFNYNYAKNIVDPVWHYVLPLWIARYNSTIGDVKPWKPILWQYTSKGHVDGINGNVDISKKVDE